MASYRLHPKGNTQGRYEITVSNGYDINGKKIRRTKTVSIDQKLTEKKKQKLLEQECIKFEEEVKGSMTTKDTMRFMDFALQVWKPNYAEQHLAITTLTRYMEFLEDRIFPAIRSFKVKRCYTTSIDEIL